MNQDPLLDQLTRDLHKPTSSRPSWRLTAYMLGMSVLCGAALIAYYGMRPDLSQQLSRTAYRSELLLLIIFAISSYAVAVRSSVPGLSIHPRISFALLFVWTVGLLKSLTQHGHSSLSASFLSGAHCLWLILICGTLPMIFALHQMRKGAPTRPRLSMGLALFGSFGAAIGVQHLICDHMDLGHLIVWHLGVLPLAVLLTWVFGRRILSW